MGRARARGDVRRLLLGSFGRGLSRGLSRGGALMTRPARLAALLALAAALAAAAGAPRRSGDRAVLAAVDSESFAGLSGRRTEAAGDLWERLKAMGVSAA